MTRMSFLFSKYFFLCWLTLWTLFSQGRCVIKKKVQQIDPVLVLLPWTPQDIPTQQVSFTLRAYGGCFEWSSQRPDLVSVNQGVSKQQGCSTSAVITPSAKSFQGGRAWVIARDKETGAELRCEVHVAAIANITIDSSARSIGVDTVETLTIRAVDDHGNVFSSLEGLWFTWQSSRLDVLNFASFHSDIYRASHTRQALQELGGQSDMVLVKGLSSGESKVTARLVSPSYQHILPAVIHLGVSEQLMIEPPFLKTIPYAMIQYHLRVLKPQIAIYKSPLVDLPSIHFRWKAEMVNCSRAKGKVEMDESKAIVYAKTTDACEAKIKVTDQRVFNYVDEGRLIITHLANFQFFYQENITHLQYLKEWMRFDANVSNPLSFVQHASPFVTVGSKSHWYFIKNRLYLLGVYGLCKEGKLLYLPSNLHMVLSCGGGGDTNDVFTLQEGRNCMGLEIVHVSKTKQYVLVKATNITTGTIQVEAPAVPHSAPNSVMTYSIRNHQKYHITYPLLVSFSTNKKHSIQHMLNNVVVLPTYHEWTFKAFGGSGEYVWLNSNTTIARIQAVPNTSVHLTTTNTVGWTEIQVLDAGNPSNHYKFFVVVSSLKYLFMDPIYDKIPVETKANIRLRGVPNAVHCSIQSPCPDLLQKWNEKVHSIKISDGVPFVEGDSNTLLSLHYLNCSSLDKSLGTPIQVDITRSDSAHPIVWDIQQKLSQGFVCGEIQFHTPSEATSLKVKAALTDKWTSTRWLHIYSPLSALVHTSYTFWKNSTHLISPITTETPPLTVAVGSWVDIQIRGGPTMESQDAVKTDVTLDQHGSNYGKVQVVPDSNDLIRFFCVDATNKTNVNLIISRKSHSTLSQQVSLTKNNALKTGIQELQKFPYILYRIIPAISKTNLHIRCSFPSRVEIHAVPSFVKSSTWKHFSERYIVSQASKTIPIEYCQCGIQHTFGLFVYGDDNTLINFWSTSYTTQWKLENEYLKKLTHPSIRYVTMDIATCHKTFTLTSFFHFNFTAWETAFGTQSNDKPGLMDLAKRVTHYIGNRFSSQREFPSLMFQLSLRGVSPLQMTPFNSLGFHIFFHDTNCARRIQIRFGSGVYRVRFTHRDKLDIFFGKSIFHSPKKSLQESYVLKKNQEMAFWPYECQEKVVHESSDSTSEESLLSKYFNAEEYENCPTFFNNTHDRCLPLQTTQVRLLDNFFEESEENEPSRQISNDIENSQHEYQWDIYVKPKQHVSPFSFSMMIYDARLLGMKEISMKYAFSALGKIRIHSNCSVYRFETRRNEKINSEFLSVIKKDIVLETSKKTIHVDVHDVVEFSIQAFDAEHDIEFLSEDINLMRICLTVTSGQDHTKLSCINKEVVPFTPYRKEDDLWATVLKQTNQSAFKTSKNNVQEKKSHIVPQKSPASHLYFQGRKSGVYTVQAVGYNGKSSTVSSEMVTVIVSDPLVLVPSKLILMPGYHTFEIKANGQQNGRPTIEKKFHITNLSIFPLLAEKSSSVVTGEWIESIASENILKNQSRSLLQITTGTCTGEATIRVTETDTSIPSFIQREVTANVIVAIPHALHISNTHLETPVYPATVLKLRAYNSHTLKAIFFTKNNQPFTLSHHYLTASSLSNKTETEEKSNGCTCEWESSRSDLLRFVNDMEKPSHCNLSTSGLGVPKLQGRGLFFVNVFPLTHQLHSPVNVVVHLVCHCTAFVSNLKHSKEIWRRTYNANVQIEIVPDSNAMIYPTFMEAYFSEKDLTHPFIHRYPYRFQVLRLVSYGHYTLKVPSNFVSARLEVEPQPVYPIAAVTFFRQTSSVSIKIFVENTQEFRVILHLLHSPSMFYDDVSLQVKVLRPMSLTVTPKMPTLHVASTVILHPLLKDEFGNPLLFPTNFQLVTQASHSSVIEEIVQMSDAHSQFGSPSVSVVGRRQGCSGLTISVQRQELDSKVVKVDSCAVRICVDVSLYPSSAYVLGGGIVHSVFAPKSSAYHTIKPEFQLRFLLKSSVVAWAWLAHASPTCVASLEKVLENNQHDVSLKFHSSLIKWLESRQAYFTYPSCDKVSHDLMQSWIRERIDAFLLENLLFHKTEAIHFKKQEAILRVLKSTNPMNTISLEDAVYCYTLTFTSDKPFRSTAYLKWIVSKVSFAVNAILKYSVKTKESSHSLHDHISWANGGILFGNGLQRITTDTSNLHPKSTTLKQTSLQLDSTDILTSSQSGTFRIPLQESLDSPSLYLNVVNEIASTCILTVWSDDYFQSGVSPFFKQASTNFSTHHTHCLDTKRTTTKTFEEALVLQEKPLTVIFLPYATSKNEDHKLVVSNPFVSQHLKVVCDIHQHPFFNVVPVYGIPLSALGLQAHTTVGCRLFPKYHLVSRAASELILTVKLKGQSSISTHLSLIWRLSWGIIVEQNSMVFSPPTVLPASFQQTIQTAIKKKGTPVTQVIQLPKDSSHPINFHVVTGETCVLEANIEDSSKVSVRLEHLGSNKTRVYLYRLTKEFPKSSSVVDTVRSTSNDCRHGCLTWLLLQCGSYSTHIPIYTALQKGSSALLDSSFLRKWMTFFNYWDLLFKVVLSLFFVVIAAFIHCMRSSRTSLDVRTQTGSALLNRVGPTTASTPYRQWNHNKQIAIGGFAAQSPSSGYRNSVKRPFDAFT